MISILGGFIAFKLSKNVIENINKKYLKPITWTNVNPKSFIDKNAIVNPSKVAGIILKSTAGLPICFI